MRSSTLETCNGFARARSLALVIGAAALLAGCETTGPGRATLAARTSTPPEPPMTRSRASTECWMKTEKGRGDGNLDKRADVVTKCIDDKMRAAQAAPSS